MTVIALVVAMDPHGVIGKDDGLPWHLPADLRHFKEVTMGKPIVMGRRTHESIGRALPGRTNIVVTRNPDYQAEGCRVVGSVDEGVALAASQAEEVMVIGGQVLFEALLPRAQRIYLTLVHHPFDGDTFFPAYDKTRWYERERVDHEADARNPYPYSFITLERARA